ncbi:MAG: hypothetical protein LBN02_01765 [Oscillospiraceae bacterium]|jgi:hypothetical protein|nr:hypothetical protein [Oscillospiraceae bacterium]
MPIILYSATTTRGTVVTLYDDGYITLNGGKSKTLAPYTVELSSRHREVCIQQGIDPETCASLGASIIIERDIAEQIVSVYAAHRDTIDPRKVIDGYAELSDAIDRNHEIRRKFDRDMDSESRSSFASLSGTIDTNELKAKYPRAAAYIKAENMSYKTNDAAATAGSRAMKRIIKGEDHETVISEMDAEWLSYCDEAMKFN